MRFNYDQSVYLQQHCLDKVGSGDNKFPYATPSSHAPKSATSGTNTG